MNNKNIKKNNKKRVKKRMRRQNRRIMRNSRRINNLRRKVNIINSTPKIVTPVRNYKRYMRVIRTDSTSMTVSGLDLVYSIPDAITQQTSKVLTIIPSNPAYWNGTRISAMALGFQQFRPLKFKIHYVPIVSSIQPGNIFGGTIWSNNPIPEQSIQQSLVTSQGGLSTQVYQTKTATVKCKANLTYNLYNIGGDLSDQSNPFYYVAIAVANFNEQNVRITPGYFWISYTYVFKNPVGNNTTFINRGITSFADIDFMINTTALLTSPINYEKLNKQITLPTFTEIQIESDEQGNLIPTYNGDYVPLLADTKLWLFQNTSNDPSTAQVRPIYRITVSSQQRIVDSNYVIHPGETIIGTLNDGRVQITTNLSTNANYMIPTNNTYYKNSMIYSMADEDFSDLNDIKISQSWKIQSSTIRWAMIFESNKSQVVELIYNPNSRRKNNAQISKDKEPIKDEEENEISEEINTCNEVLNK